jgi:hypothetical protein
MPKAMNVQITVKNQAELNAVLGWLKRKGMAAVGELPPMRPVGLTIRASTDTMAYGVLPADESLLKNSYGYVTEPLSFFEA